jgi:signal transduction histidine kinase
LRALDVPRFSQLDVALRRLARGPKRTIRLRLTVRFGGLFIGAGVLLLTLTYVLVAQTPSWLQVDPPAPPDVPTGGAIPLPQAPTVADAATEASRQRQHDLRQLVVASGSALLCMTFVSAGLGWWTAGRALRPLRQMAATARTISARDLRRRLDVRGPADEIKDLADTFDELLDHLDGAFEAQRRFVANASHELRTPLTFERSLLEVALANPDPTAAELREVCRRVLVNNQEQGRLIEALLTLARSQRGLDRRTDLDLAALTGDILAARPVGSGLRIEQDLDAAPVTGDAPLLERLIANLIDNALRHNLADGWVNVRTGLDDDTPTLRIRNSGPVIPPEQRESLLEPFQRLDAGRSNTHHDGHGLGLSIVAAIAAAHDAELHADPMPDGGLDVHVTFQPR